MTSFIKLGIFEREAKTPALNVKQLALLLCGEDPELKTAEIPQGKILPYNIYYRHISKWMQSSNLFSGGNAAPQPADFMFAMALPMVDDELTPEPIKNRCLKAAESIATRNNGKEYLFKIGGQELYDIGVVLSKNKRGQYRKADEENNTIKLIGLLVKLLVKKVGHAYSNNNKPAVSVIFKDIESLAKDEGISLRGISKSTVYKKISEAISELSVGDE